MDNRLVTKDNTTNMGANSNPNAARLATLQERKQSIEETLAKRNQELRQLCIQEAELTGIMPTEIPLQPGESPPIFRRRIGTSFQLPQNLINNLDNEDESIASLELNMQVQANMAEAALSLANECNISKTIRRQHMTQYQYHKRQYNSLEEKLSFLKTRAQMSQQSHLPLQQQKQKKKPRPVDQADDAVSVGVQQTEPFAKSVFRHSMRSLQHSLSEESSVDSASIIYSKYGYRNLEYNQHHDMGGPLVRSEEALVSGIYRLSLNGYKAYMERKENTHIIGNSHVLPHFSSSPSNSNLYQHSSKQQLSNMQGSSHTLPHGSQRNQPPGHPFPMYPQYNTNLHHCQSMHDYPKYTMGNIYNNNSLRQLNSSNCSGNSKSYSPSMYTNRPYSNIEMQHRTSNPHQIQPHQQYEHSIMSTGLGGYWKRLESGELVWCNSSPSESWQRDKRFGSLDRRRNKRIHKKTSPLVDPKSATISTVTQYQEAARTTVSKAQQIASRISQDNRQLVRTQSLGSVGAQTTDNVWPSDDNSSCGSDAHSINELSVTVRKQKEWFETSLDGPASSPPLRPHSIVSSTIATSIVLISPEEKYIENLPLQSLSSPQLHKPSLEIPAESHPHLSPTVHEPNLELFNNIPKNGTLIQAGQCKPYHEETKPFEMSDFYKYSTKFKKSSLKPYNNSSQLSPICLHNLNDNMNDNANNGIQVGTGTYQPLKCRSNNLNNNFEASVDGNTTPNSSINPSLNLNQLTSNVAENFSTEMNMWYENREQQLDNTERDDISNRSTATLV